MKLTRSAVWPWLAGGALFALLASVLSLVTGPAGIDRTDALIEAFDRLTPGSIESGLSATQQGIVWNLRLPRIALGLLVGASLATAGATFQGVFRNPLADPFLLGVAPGAGLGATLAIVYDWGDGQGFLDPVQIAAFAGALISVSITWAVGVLGDKNRSPASLLLAGVAVASFFSAVQTAIQQGNQENLREIFSWFLGGLITRGWSETLQLLPMALLCIAVLVLAGRMLDTLAVGDREAESLGVPVGTLRLMLVVVASLLTASAVAVSGLISFVGLIVPHTARLLAGSSYRIVTPVSIAIGAGFMVICDLLARTLITGTEIPIGVITAFFGAPFFVVILRASTR